MMKGEKMLTLGEKLRDLRKKMGISLDEVADKTGTSKSYLWELERNPERKPSADKLSVLADFYHVSISFLLEEEEKQPDLIQEQIFTRIKKMTPDDKEKVNKILETFFDDTS